MPAKFVRREMTTRDSDPTTVVEWAARQGGTHDGRYAQIPFPAEQVETLTFAGCEMRRVATPGWVQDVPSDWTWGKGNAVPVLIVPAAICARR